MKRDKKLIRILSIVVIIVSLIWWNVPSSITNIKPSDVSKIEIFDGSTGKNVTITDEDDITHIIENLNSTTVKKEKISLGYMGYLLRTTIYKKDDTVYKKFIINSSNTVRKDPFFYRDRSNSIDYNYIRALTDSKN